VRRRRGALPAGHETGHQPRAGCCRAEGRDPSSRAVRAPSRWLSAGRLQRGGSTVVPTAITAAPAPPGARESLTSRAVASGTRETVSGCGGSPGSCEDTPRVARPPGQRPRPRVIRSVDDLRGERPPGAGASPRCPARGPKDGSGTPASGPPARHVGVADWPPVAREETPGLRRRSAVVPANSRACPAGCGRSTITGGAGAQRDHLAGAQAGGPGPRTPQAAAPRPARSRRSSSRGRSAPPPARPARSPSAAAGERGGRC